MGDKLVEEVARAIAAHLEDDGGAWLFYEQEARAAIAVLRSNPRPQGDEAVSDEPSEAEITFCTYGQCADSTVPCPRCTVIVVGGSDGD